MPRGWKYLKHKGATRGRDAKTPAAVPTFRSWGLDDIWIQTKDGELLSLGQNLNPIQEQILDDVAPRWRQGDCAIRKGLRTYELKARQFGVTTLYVALYLLQVLNNPDTNAVIIADDAQNTAVIFAKARLMYDQLPSGERPRIRYSTKSELVFGDLRSTFRVLTAGAGRTGHSRTIQYLHCSEVGFWPKASLTMGGLLQSVPASGCVTIESTANGEGDEKDGVLVGGEGAFFHVEWKKAQAGRNGFSARFTPWYRHPQYVAEPSAGWARINRQMLERLQRELGDESGQAEYDALARRYLLLEYPDEGGLPSEDAYARRFELTEAQLCWRRRKIDEPGQGILFRQEYPTTPEEAFLLSGASFFTAWSERDHVIPRDDVPDWWHYAGGYDWGQSSPFSFHLGAWDPEGRAQIIEEAYEAGLTEEEQAQRIIAALKRRNKEGQEQPFSKRGGWWGWQSRMGWQRLDIFADPSIFPPRDPTKRVGRYRVEAFWDEGLNLIPAENNRAETNANARNYMQRPGYLKVQRTCPHLIRTIPLARRHPLKPEDFELTDDHAIDSGARYLLSSRPVTPLDPDELAREAEERERQLAPEWSAVRRYQEQKPGRDLL